MLIWLHRKFCLLCEMMIFAELFKINYSTGFSKNQ